MTAWVTACLLSDQDQALSAVAAAVYLVAVADFAAEVGSEGKAALQAHAGPP